jgi:ABC-type Mn2+/Zn2+ transport system permease subunit
VGGALVDPFLDNEFMVRALVAGVLVAVSCAVVGTYVVLRGLAFIGEALGHGVLPGVAVAVLLEVSGLLGAAVAAAVMITGVSWITRRSILTSSTAIGLLFVGMLALGVVIVSRSEAFAGDLTRILFGDILGTGWDDVWIQLGVTFGVVVTVIVCARPFLLLCFDREQAQTAGFSPRLYDGLMLATIAATVVVSFQSVGTLLVLGMLLAPAGAAALVTSTIASAMVLSAFLGTGSVYGGLLISYHFDFAAGATIVLVAVALFFAFLVVRTLASPWRVARGGET